MSIDLPAIPPVKGTLVVGDAEAFYDKADLTYRSFNEQTLNDVSARQSLLTGSVFSNTSIEECDFSRSDFEGAQIANSSITGTQFVNCDIRSCRFTQTSFIRCNFRNALLSYCEFDHCEFIDCDFGQAILSEIKADGSIFSRCQNAMATITHGEFVRCRFTEMKFADCTFLLHILDDCAFNDCGINVDSLGAVYGLSESDISTFRLFYLGQEQVTPDVPSLVKTLFAEFAKRRWHFKLIMLAWNMGDISTVAAIRALMSMFKSHVDEGVLLQPEELRFVSRVAEHLTRTGRLPPIAAADGYEQTTALAMAVSQLKGYPQSELSRLAMVFLAAIESTQDEFHRLAGEFNQVANDFDTVVVMMRFDRRPQVGTSDLINALAVIYGFPPDAHRLKESTGSYVEWVQTTIAGLFAFRLVLFALNGCLKEGHALVDNLHKFCIEPVKRKPHRQVARRTKDDNKLLKSLRSSKALSDEVIKDFTASNIKDCAVVTEDLADTGTRVSKPRGRKRRPVQD